MNKVMMSNLQEKNHVQLGEKGVEVFNNPEFGEVRIATINNQEMFCLSDIGRTLELSQPSKVKERLNEKGVNSIPTLTNGGMQSLLCIDEYNLDECKSFKEFFIKVNKIKMESDFRQLGQLANKLNEYMPIYGCEAIIYLKDCVFAERALPCNSPKVSYMKESEMKEYIINNFNKIFPQYEYVGTEVPVDSIGRIDILAKKDEHAVIIELKVEKKNPNTQLLAYGSKFDNPILIGITQESLPKKCRLKNITYFTFERLKQMVDKWND